MMLVRFAIYLTGFAMTIIGAASYFAAVPIFVGCKSVVCEISTSVVTLDLALLVVGLGLLSFARFVLKSKVPRRP